MKDMLLFSLLVSGLLIPATVMFTDQVNAASMTNDLKEQLVASVKSAIDERSKLTGTFDYFDDGINAVRNLNWMNVGQVEMKGDAYQVLIDFRDMSSGDIVTMDFSVIEDGDDLTLDAWKISKVEELKKNVEAEKKEYTDAEIQAFMKDYLEKKTKFTGTYDIFDQDAKTMRNLQLGEFKPEVRKFGSLFISTIEVVDAKTEKALGLDITVQRKDGALKVKTVRFAK